MRPPKPASTAFPVHDLVSGRWSPRAFRPEPLAHEHLGSLLEAVRWSASCFNDQPWDVVVCARDDAESFARLLGALVPANQTWARDAGALLLTTARTAFAHNGKDNAWARHDVGLATGQMLLQAEAMGLAVHAMAGFDPDAARAAVDLPASHEPVAVLAVGHPGDGSGLPPELAQREGAARVRRGLHELWHAGRFGSPGVDPA